MTAIFTRRANINSAVDAERSARSVHAFSWSRALSMVAAGHVVLDGYEGEVMTELARVIGPCTGGGLLPLPLPLLADPYVRPETLVRDLSAGISTAGGHLVGATVAPVSELMKPWSTVIKAGATVIDGGILVGTGSIDIPKIPDGMIGYWVDPESAPIPQSDPLIHKTTMAPKTGGTTTKFSHLLAKQTNIADALLQRHMLGVIGGLIDSAAIAGTGLNGQPTGIVSTSGVANSGGPGVNYDMAVIAEYNATMAGGMESFGFLTHPVVKASYRTSDGVGFYTNTSERLDTWKSGAEGDRFIGWPAFVTDQCPSNIMVAGPWSDCLVTIWGVPLLQVNPYEQTDFKTGLIQARVTIDCDTAPVHPGAWMKFTNLNNSTTIEVI